MGTEPLTTTEERAWTIGELAKRLDLNPRTIRYYERIHLVPEPKRTEAGYRRYGTEDEERVRFIKSAQRLGLTLGEIGEVLAFRQGGQPPCSYVASVIEQRLGEVNQRLRDLRAFRSELTELRDRMRAEGIVEGSDSYCHYIQSHGQLR
jgi:DNA-binding transcriptional MerR regulator